MPKHDLIFVISAVAFNLLIAGLLFADVKEQPALVKTLGTIWLLLVIPLAFVFFNYLKQGKDSVILLSFGGVFLYMFIEWILDYVIKFDFREKAITHVPYIIMEYIALFSLIGISNSISKTATSFVGGSFAVLMVSLVYYMMNR